MYEMSSSRSTELEQLVGFFFLSGSLPDKQANSALRPELIASAYFICHQPYTVLKKGTKIRSGREACTLVTLYCFPPYSKNKQKR